MRRLAKTSVLLACVVVASGTELSSARRSTTDAPRLVSFDPYPGESEGASCAWDDAVGQPIAENRPSFQSIQTALFTQASATALQAQQAGPGARAPRPALLACTGAGCEEVAKQKPVRFIQDLYPGFSGVNIDLVHNEVILNDENKFNVLVYDRLTNTAPGAPKAEPKRTIGGLKTRLQLSSATYVDPKSGEIYAVNNDSLKGMMVFSREKQGNVKYDRYFPAPYGSYGIAADEAKQELFVTVQHDSAVQVWPKMFTEDVTALRLLQGSRTHMADPHGIAFDAKNQQIFVANYGTSRQAIAGTIGGVEPTPFPRPINRSAGNHPEFRHEVIPGSGKFGPPSVTVYPADAVGNTAPLRIIEGPKTQLNWPTGMAVDPEHGEIYVSNAVGDSVVVFSSNAQGDVAPIRILKGARTQLANPTGLSFDPVNDELWVANFGNHMATVYKRTASGDTAPLRVIRSSPPDQKGATLISNPFAVAYDSKRDQLVVPNCVGQPRIAIFEKLADKAALPVRKVEGSKTHLNRTVHSVQYDAIHDEIIVNQNIGQAILTFRGAADGEEAPVRVIQGPATMLKDPEKVVVDAVHDEIYAIMMTSGFERGADRVLVFDRKAQGNVAPIRILSSPGAFFSAGVVDPVHNLLFLSARIKGVGSRVMVFDRTADGPSKPKAILGGPKSGLSGASVLAVYPPAGKLVLLTGGSGDGDDDADTAITGAYAGVWNITDDGDVPPQYTVGKGMLAQVRGMALDTKDKNIVISDKYLAGVLTFSLPQMFVADAPRSTSSSR